MCDEDCTTNTCIRYFTFFLIIVMYFVFNRDEIYLNTIPEEANIVEEGENVNMMLANVTQWKRVKIVGDKIFWTIRKQQVNSSIVYIKRDTVPTENTKKPRGIILFAEEHNIKNKSNKTKNDNAFNKPHNIKFYTVKESPSSFMKKQKDLQEWFTKEHI